MIRRIVSAFAMAATLLLSSCGTFRTPTWVHNPGGHDSTIVVLPYDTTGTWQPGKQPTASSKQSTR